MTKVSLTVPKHYTRAPKAQSIKKTSFKPMKAYKPKLSTIKIPKTKGYRI